MEKASRENGAGGGGGDEHVGVVLFVLKLIVANMSDFAQSSAAARVSSPSMSPLRGVGSNMFASIGAGIGSPQRGRSPAPRSESPTQPSQRARSPNSRGGMSVQDQLDEILAREQLILDLLCADSRASTPSPGNSGVQRIYGSMRMENHDCDATMPYERSSSNRVRIASDAGCGFGSSVAFEARGNVSGKSAPKPSNAGGRMENMSLRLDVSKNGLPVFSDKCLPINGRTSKSAQGVESSAPELLDDETLEVLALADEGLGWTSNKQGNFSRNYFGNGHHCQSRILGSDIKSAGTDMLAGSSAENDILTTQELLSIKSEDVEGADIGNQFASQLDARTVSVSLPSPNTNLQRTVEPSVFSFRSKVGAKPAPVSDRSNTLTERASVSVKWISPAENVEEPKSNDIQHPKVPNCRDSEAVAAEAALPGNMDGDPGGLLKILRFPAPSDNKVR